MSTTDNRPAEGDRAARWSERTKASVTDLAGVPVLPPEPPEWSVIEIVGGPHAGERYLRHPDEYKDRLPSALVVDTWAELLKMAGPAGVRVVKP